MHNRYNGPHEIIPGPIRFGKQRRRGRHVDITGQTRGLRRVLLCLGFIRLPDGREVTMWETECLRCGDTEDMRGDALRVTVGGEGCRRCARLAAARTAKLNRPAE